MAGVLLDPIILHCKKLQNPNCFFCNWTWRPMVIFPPKMARTPGLLWEYKKSVIILLNILLITASVLLVILLVSGTGQWADPTSGSVPSQRTLTPLPFLAPTSHSPFLLLPFRLMANTNTNFSLIIKPNTRAKASPKGLPCPIKPSAQVRIFL